MLDDGALLLEDEVSTLDESLVQTPSDGIFWLNKSEYRQELTSSPHANATSHKTKI